MDDGGISASNIILFLFLLSIQAILIGFGKAINLMNEKEIERKAKEENDKKSILLNNIAIRSTIHVNSIQMITTLIEVMMGYLFIPKWTSALRVFFTNVSWFENISVQYVYMISLVASIVILLYLMLTLGILLPKKLAQRYPDAWAYAFVSYIQFLRTLLYPLTGIVAISANILLNILGFRNDDEQSDVTEEEIISMVNEGHEQGVLEADEVEMITNIFEFGDKEAGKIMTNRNSIMAIESHTPLKEAIDFMLSEGNSRYPVYKETLDQIIGVLYLKDAMRIHTLDEGMNKPVEEIKGLVRDAVFVPETKNIDDLFRSMQSEKNQMVIVMDEYGQTLGLVTMEDILEEIVGNIMDEYDSEDNHIKEKSDGEYIIEGITKIETVEECLNIDLGETEFETLNGYIISKIERIPKKNEKLEIQVNGYNFKIINVEKNVIKSVLVTKIHTTEENDETETVNN